MYDHVVKTVTTATDSLTRAGHTFEVVALLYLQGESDSAAEATVADTRMMELTDHLRRDLPSANGLRVIIAGIAASGGTRDVVRAKHAALALDSGTFSFFATTDLRQHLPDQLHFDKMAKLIVGERFAEAWLKQTTHRPAP